ncbi:MAG: hypothetical protein ABI700_24675 [Chloroflexota bacterium]
MSDDAKRLNIRWRRILFSFHLLLMLGARLAVGSIHEMPPPEIYHMFEVWGFIILIHAVVQAVLDGRDRADLPIRWLNRVIEPRERRYTLLTIDALVWVMMTVALANRVIPEQTIVQYAVPLALLWLALTGIGLAHLLLLVYAEIRDRAPIRKRKNNAMLQGGETLTMTSDGELLETIDEARQRIN